MVAVAVAAAKTIGVVADGLGPEFKPFGKSTAVLLLGRFKEKKLVDLGLVALNNFYGHALSIDQIFSQVDNIVFPKKEGSKMPPHAQIGALNFINGAVIKHQFPMSPAETKDVADLGMRVLTKISDPKVKTAAQEFMVRGAATQTAQTNLSPPPLMLA